MSKPINEESIRTAILGEEIEDGSAVYLAEDGTAFKCIEMYKYFSLKQIFSIVDGRLSTNMNDVHAIINIAFKEEPFTHQLPEMMDVLRDQRPKWYRQAEELIDYIKWEYRTDEFGKLMAILDSDYPNVFIKVEQIK